MIDRSNPHNLPHERSDFRSDEDDEELLERIDQLVSMPGEGRTVGAKWRPPKLFAPIYHYFRPVKILGGNVEQRKPRAICYAAVFVTFAILLSVLSYAWLVPKFIQWQINRTDLNVMQVSHARFKRFAKDRVDFDLSASLPAQLFLPINAKIAPLQLDIIDETVTSGPLMKVNLHEFTFSVHKTTRFEFVNVSLVVDDGCVERLALWIDQLSNKGGLEHGSTLLMKSDLKVEWLGIVWYHSLPVYRRFVLPKVEPSLVSVYNSLPGYTKSLDVEDQRGALVVTQKLLSIRRAVISLSDRGAIISTAIRLENPTVASLVLESFQFRLSLERNIVAVVCFSEMELQQGSNLLEFNVFVDFEHDAVAKHRMADVLATTIRKMVYPRNSEEKVLVAIQGPISIGRAHFLSKATFPLRLDLPVHEIASSLSFLPVRNALTAGGVSKILNELSLALDMRSNGLKSNVSLKLPHVIDIVPIEFDYPISFLLANAKENFFRVDLGKAKVEATKNVTLLQICVSLSFSNSERAAREFAATVNPILLGLDSQFQLRNMSISVYPGARSFKWSDHMFRDRVITFPFPGISFAKIVRSMTLNGSSLPFKPKSWAVEVDGKKIQSRGQFQTVFPSRLASLLSSVTIDVDFFAAGVYLGTPSTKFLAVEFNDGLYLEDGGLSKINVTVEPSQKHPRLTRHLQNWASYILERDSSLKRVSRLVTVTGVRFGTSPSSFIDFFAHVKFPLDITQISRIYEMMRIRHLMTFARPGWLVSKLSLGMKDLNSIVGTAGLEAAGSCRLFSGQIQLPSVHFSSYFTEEFANGQLRFDSSAVALGGVNLSFLLNLMRVSEQTAAEIAAYLEGLLGLLIPDDLPIKVTSSYPAYLAASKPLSLRQVSIGSIDVFADSVLQIPYATVALMASYFLGDSYLIPMRRFLSEVSGVLAETVPKSIFLTTDTRYGDLAATLSARLPEWLPSNLNLNFPALGSDVIIDDLSLLQLVCSDLNAADNARDVSGTISVSFVRQSYLAQYLIKRFAQKLMAKQHISAKVEFTNLAFGYSPVQLHRLLRFVKLGYNLELDSGAVVDRFVGSLLNTQTSSLSNLLSVLKFSVNELSLSSGLDGNLVFTTFGGLYLPFTVGLHVDSLFAEIYSDKLSVLSIEVSEPLQVSACGRAAQEQCFAAREVSIKANQKSVAEADVCQKVFNATRRAHERGRTLKLTGILFGRKRPIDIFKLVELPLALPNMAEWLDAKLLLPQLLTSLSPFATDTGALHDTYLEDVQFTRKGVEFNSGASFGLPELPFPIKSFEVLLRYAASSLYTDAHPFLDVELERLSVRKLANESTCVFRAYTKFSWTSIKAVDEASKLIGEFCSREGSLASTMANSVMTFRALKLRKASDAETTEICPTFGQEFSLNNFLSHLHTGAHTWLGHFVKHEMPLQFDKLFKTLTSHSTSHTSALSALSTQASRNFGLNFYPLLRFEVESLSNPESNALQGTAATEVDKSFNLALKVKSLIKWLVRPLPISMTIPGISFDMAPLISTTISHVSLDRKRKNNHLDSVILVKALEAFKQSSIKTLYGLLKNVTLHNFQLPPSDVAPWTTTLLKRLSFMLDIQSLLDSSFPGLADMLANLRNVWLKLASKFVTIEALKADFTSLPWEIEVFAFHTVDTWLLRYLQFLHNLDLDFDLQSPDGSRVATISAVILITDAESSRFSISIRIEPALVVSRFAKDALQCILGGLLGGLRMPDDLWILSKISLNKKRAMSGISLPLGKWILPILNALKSVAKTANQVEVEKFHVESSSAGAADMVADLLLTLTDLALGFNFELRLPAAVMQLKLGLDLVPLLRLGTYNGEVVIFTTRLPTPSPAYKLWFRANNVAVDLAAANQRALSVYLHSMLELLLNYLGAEEFVHLRSTVAEAHDASSDIMVTFGGLVLSSTDMLDKLALSTKLSSLTRLANNLFGLNNVAAAKVLKRLMYDLDVKEIPVSYLADGSVGLGVSATYLPLVSSGSLSISLPKVEFSVANGRYGTFATVAVDQFALTQENITIWSRVTLLEDKKQFFNWLISDIVGNMVFHRRDLFSADGLLKDPSRMVFAFLDLKVSKSSVTGEKAAVRSSPGQQRLLVASNEDRPASPPVHSTAHGQSNLREAQVAAAAGVFSALSYLSINFDVKPVLAFAETVFDNERLLEIGRLDAAITPRGVEGLLQTVPFRSILRPLVLKSIPCVTASIYYKGKTAIRATFYEIEHAVGAPLQVKAWLLPVQPTVNDGLAEVIPRMVRFEDYAQFAEIGDLKFHSGMVPPTATGADHPAKSLSVFFNARIPPSPLYLYRPIVLYGSPSVQGGLGMESMIGFYNVGPLSLDVGELSMEIRNNGTLMAYAKSNMAHIHSAHDNGGMTILQLNSRLLISSLLSGGAKAAYARLQDLFDIMNQYKTFFKLKQRGTGLEVTWISPILDKVPLWIASQLRSTVTDFLKWTVVCGRRRSFFDTLRSRDKLSSRVESKFPGLLNETKGVVQWKSYVRSGSVTDNVRPIFTGNGITIAGRGATSFEGDRQLLWSGLLDSESQQDFWNSTSPGPSFTFGERAKASASALRQKLSSFRKINSSSWINSLKGRGKPTQTMVGRQHSLPVMSNVSELVSLNRTEILRVNSLPDMD